MSIRSLLGRCPKRRTPSSDLMAIVEGKCPDCGAKELHSASLDGKEAMSCTECEWIRSYDQLRERVP